jgi:hypothetical protein
MDIFQGVVGIFYLYGFTIIGFFGIIGHENMDFLWGDFTAYQGGQRFFANDIGTVVRRDGYHIFLFHFTVGVIGFIL